MALRNCVMVFLVSCLFSFFSPQPNLGPLRLAMANVVDLQSTDLGPDRISVTASQISDLIARTEAELDEAKKAQEDNAKIEMLNSKVKDLVTARLAMENWIPGFYDRHAEIWRELAFARNLLNTMRGVTNLSPPYSWIVQAGQKFIDDWDANSIAKFISEIVLRNNNQSIAKQANIHLLIIEVNKPMKKLKPFLDSLPWKAFLAYLNVSARIAHYQAMFDRDELRVDEHEALHVFLKNVKYLLKLIEDKLISLMPLKEDDPLLTKFRNLNFENTDERLLEEYIFDLNEYITDAFNEMQQQQQQQQQQPQHVVTNFSRIESAKKWKNVFDKLMESKRRLRFSPLPIIDEQLPNDWDDSPRRIVGQSRETIFSESSNHKKRFSLSNLVYGLTFAILSTGGGYYLWKQGLLRFNRTRNDSKIEMWQIGDDDDNYDDNDNDDNDIVATNIRIVIEIFIIFIIAIFGCFAWFFWRKNRRRSNSDNMLLPTNADNRTKAKLTSNESQIPAPYEW